MKARSRNVLVAVAITAGPAYGALGDAIAINAPVEAGNQAYGEGLGIDFTVNSQITITELGIFDDNGDGIAQQPGPPPTDTTLTAALYSVDRTDDTSTEIASQDFTTSDPGTLASGSGFRFIQLATPITLAPGTYDIAGYGFNSENLEVNSSAGQQLNTGGGVITFNATYYSFLGEGAAPENYDSSVIKYAAATFEYTGESPFVRTWNGSTSGNWSNGGNWNEGALAANGTDVLEFVGVGSGDTQTMDNDLSNLAVNGMDFSVGGYALNGNALTNNGNIVSSTGNNTVNVPLTLNGSGTNIEVDAGTLTLAGNVSAPLPVSGPQFLTKTGAGTLVLGGNNDLQSGLIIDGGIVQMADVSDNASTTSLTVPGQGGGASNGLLAIYDGTAEVTGTGTQTTARYIYTDQGTNHTLSLDSASLTVVSTGEWRSNGTLAAELVKEGAGTLVLSGSDPFFAATTGDRAYNFISVQAGTVILDRSVGSAVDGVDGIASGALVMIGAGATNDEIFTDLAGAYTPVDSAVASNPGLLNITGGTFDLNGQSELINRLNGIGTVTNSGSGLPATLTIGQQNLNAAPGSDNGSFAGVIQDGAGQVAVTMMGSGNTQVLSGVNTYSGATNLNGGVLSVASLADGGSASGIGQSSNAAANLVLSGGTLQYTGAGASIDRLFTVTPAGGSLDASGTGALVFSNTAAITDIDAASRTAVEDGTTDVVTGLANVADLAVGMTVTGTNLPAGTTIASIDPGNNSVTLSQVPTAAGTDTLSFGLTSRTLTLTGSNTGGNTLAASLQDSVGGASLALNKTGAGTWQLTGNNTYGGGTTVNAGDLVVAAHGALPGSSVVTINGGTLQLAANTGGQTLSSLSVAANGALDIGNNHIVLSDPGGSIDSTIRSYLAAGYNNGNWNGTSAAGGSIVTSSATGTKYGIGYADGADGGISGITSGQLEVKYTLYGDANLDGSVNSIDFGDLAANFGKSGKVWDQGDFNYDDTVNSIDFGLLAGNFGKSVGGNADVVSAADWAALDAFAAANGLMADVPEPASASLVLFAGLSVLTCRRRRKRA